MSDIDGWIVAGLILAVGLVTWIQNRYEAWKANRSSERKNWRAL